MKNNRFYIVLLILLSIPVSNGHAQENLLSRDDNEQRLSYHQSNVVEHDDLLQDICDDIIENSDALDDEEEAMNMDEYYDVLSSLALQKRNINELTMDDLLQVPLLNESVVYALLNYRELYGAMRSMAELQMINGIDEAHAKLLRYLFYAEPISKKQKSPWQTMFSDGKHSVIATLRVPMYKRLGEETPLAAGGYHGIGLSNTVRYKYTSRNLQMALTASQDAGEPFFAGANKKGWDFYTGYVRLCNIGFIENLVAGHFKVSSGMGLLMNSGFTLSRTMLLSSLPVSSFSISGHSSRSEQNYFQGLAVTMCLGARYSAFGNEDHSNAVDGENGKLQLSLFASSRSIDAILSSYYPTTITSILSTGYHRTDTELLRRDVSRKSDMGLNLSYRLPYFLLFGGTNSNISATVLYTHLSEPLFPNKSQRYRWFYPQGSNFLSGSISYSMISPKLQFAGETALSQRAVYTGEGSDGYVVPKDAPDEGLALATTNELIWKASSVLSLVSQQRYFSYRFESLNGRSLGFQKNVQDESGVLVGLIAKPFYQGFLSHLTFSAYADAAYHPWARYGYSDTSRSWDSNIMADYENNNLSVSLRYRYRENALTDIASFLPEFQASLNGKNLHNVKLKVKLSSGSWLNTTQAQMSFATAKERTSGFMISHVVGFNKMRKESLAKDYELLPDGTIIPYDSTKTVGNMLQEDRVVFKKYDSHKRGYDLSIGITYFNTDDYASRLYVQEPTVRFGTTTSMVYGHGFRAVAKGSLMLAPRICLSAVATLLHYFDRDTISSGMQMINSNNKTDILLQLEWNL